MTLTKEKESIIVLFNLENEDVEVVSFSNEGDTAVVHILKNIPNCVWSRVAPR